MIVKRYLNAGAQRVRAVLGYDLQLGIAQNSLIVLAGQLIRLMLGLISSALLARGLGPIGLSIFSVIGAATNIGLTVSDGGLSNSAVRQIAGDVRQRPDLARRTASSYARFKLLGGLALAVIAIALAHPLIEWLNLPAESGPALIWIAAAGLFASVLGGITGTILQALRRFRALVTIQTLNAALTVILLAALFFLRRLTVLPALLIVGAITTGLATLLSVHYLPTDWRAAIFSKGQWLNSESRRLLTFSKWMWISAILSILASQLDPLLLNRAATPQIVGLYALALNLAAKVDLLNQTLHVVLLPTVSTLASSDTYRLYIRRSLTRSLLMSILIIAALPFARPFILMIYGSAFAESVNVFYGLIAIVLFDLAVNPILLLAFPMNMPRLIAVSDGARVIGLVIVSLWLIPIGGMYGVVLAKLAGRIAGALVIGTAIFLRLRHGPPSVTPAAPAPDTSIPLDVASPDPR